MRFVTVYWRNATEFHWCNFGSFSDGLRWFVSRWFISRIYSVRLRYDSMNTLDHGIVVWLISSLISIIDTLKRRLILIWYLIQQIAIPKAFSIKIIGTFSHKTMLISHYLFMIALCELFLFIHKLLIVQ